MNAQMALEYLRTTIRENKVKNKQEVYKVIDKLAELFQQEQELADKMRKAIKLWDFKIGGNE